MNYFRCTVSGSGGKWKLTVTCTNVFAGLTITCTDGTTTLTKTCPSSSPYTVVFNIPNGGTWTISGVYGGKTNTTTVVIPDTATLNYIPTGSTATPINDIQTWLHCANIWDKTYTTISQVLADGPTLLALISSNNAVDYMVRSTNWASSVCTNQTAMGYIGNNNYCANKLLANSTWLNAICNSTYFESVLNVKVPTMTSNTTPSGICSSSTVGSGAAWNVFDGNDSTFWQQSGTPSNVAYTFTSAMKAYMARLLFIDSRKSATYVIQGYNGSSWVDLTTSTTATTADNKIIFSKNIAAYTSYRIYISAYTGNQIAVATLQVYGRAS